MISEISSTRIRRLITPAAVVTAICLFALFIHGGPYQRMMAVAALGSAAITISLSIPDLESLRTCLGLSGFSKKIAVCSLAGAGLGVLLAVRYRSIAKIDLLPQTLTIIAVIAPLIGSAEELLFRGFLQGKLSGINIYAAILLSTSGHTLYKYLVLWSLPSAGGVDFLSLVVFTFIVGLICGLLRVLSKSIIPACVSHAVFDVLVYGGLAAWPVWVWN
jgi:membrane protease YdiL (CAAX protease family)